MASLNRAMLIGHLGKDPKIATLNSGSKVASFSVATSEHWKDKTTGERRERTQWHNVVIFNEALVRVAESYLKKGAQVYLEGAIETRKYADQTGAERYVTEIVLRPFAGEIKLIDKTDRPSPSPDSYGTTRTRDTPPGSRPATSPDLDDDIPF